MRRSRSKRVSFHQEVTVKEFIKKQNGTQDSGSEFDSPDLYRAPINHCGSADDLSEDSNMDLTDIVIPPLPQHKQESDGSMMDLTLDATNNSSPGELTTMIANDMREYRTENSFNLGDFTEIVSSKHTEQIMNKEKKSLDMTMLPVDDLENFAKKILPAGMTFSEDSPDTSLNSVRRSQRLAKRSSESTPGEASFVTPQVRLTKGRKRGSAMKHVKNTSMLNSRSSTQKSVHVSQLGTISLVDESVASDVSLLSVSADESSYEQGQKKIEERQQLQNRLTDARKKHEEAKAELEEWKEKIRVVEENIKMARTTTMDPFNCELIQMLKSG